MTVRIKCEVPGCRRTYHNREGFDGWVCADHWRLAPAKMKRQRTAAKRRGKHRLANWLWARCVTEIIARALSGGDLI